MCASGGLQPAFLSCVKSVQSTLTSYRVSLNECSPSAIMALPCENDIFMARSYKQSLPKIAQ